MCGRGVGYRPLERADSPGVDHRADAHHRDARHQHLVRSGRGLKSHGTDARTGFARRRRTAGRLPGSVDARREAAVTGKTAMEVSDVLAGEQVAEYFRRRDRLDELRVDDAVRGIVSA